MFTFNSNLPKTVYRSNTGRPIPGRNSKSLQGLTNRFFYLQVKLQSPDPIFPQLSISKKHFPTNVRFLESHSTHTVGFLLCFRDNEGYTTVINKSPPRARQARLCAPSRGWLAPRKFSRFGDVCRNQPFHQQVQSILLDLFLLGARKHPFLSKSFPLCLASWMKFFPWSPATPSIANFIQQTPVKCPLDTVLC